MITDRNALATIGHPAAHTPNQHSDTQASQHDTEGHRHSNTEAGQRGSRATHHLTVPTSQRRDAIARCWPTRQLEARDPVIIAEIGVDGTKPDGANCSAPDQSRRQSWTLTRHAHRRRSVRHQRRIRDASTRQRRRRPRLRAVGSTTTPEWAAVAALCNDCHDKLHNNNQRCGHFGRRGRGLGIRPSRS